MKRNSQKSAGFQSYQEYHKICMFHDKDEYDNVVKTVFC